MLVCFIGFIIPISQDSLVFGQFSQNLTKSSSQTKTAEGCIELIYYKLSGKLGTSCDRADFCRVLPYMECSLTQSRRCVCMSGYQAVSGQCKGEHLHILLQKFCVYSWPLAQIFDLRLWLCLYALAQCWCVPILGILCYVLMLIYGANTLTDILLDSLTVKTNLL